MIKIQILLYTVKLKLRNYDYKFTFLYKFSYLFLIFKSNQYGLRYRVKDAKDNLVLNYEYHNGKDFN
jgi:hypothetical protein